MYYGQNREDEIISQFFGNHVGTLLDIGANNGVTYSNSRLLIQRGWSGMLVEPSNKVIAKLCNLYLDNPKIYIAHVAVGKENQKAAVFYDSGEFLIKDTCSLLSTIKKDEVKRWGEVCFEEY